MKSVLVALPGIIVTVLCWGAYGPVLHKGQTNMHHERLKPLICVGLAYFLIAIVIPTIFLATSGKLSTNWSTTGVIWSLASGAAGAIGALGIIWALSSGGAPEFVMPLVFGGAPIVNVMVSLALRGEKLSAMGRSFPFFLAGVIMVGMGAFLIMFFAPKPAKKPTAPTPATTTSVSGTTTASPTTPDKS